MESNGSFMLSTKDKNTGSSIIGVSELFMFIEHEQFRNSSINKQFSKLR